MPHQLTKSFLGGFASAKCVQYLIHEVFSHIYHGPTERGCIIHFVYRKNIHMVILYP
jgi:hypothetical protein